MKKILLGLSLSLLFLLTLHVSLSQYGGILGAFHRVQGRIVTSYARTVRDPGACALIRGYWGRSTHEKLRDRCVTSYIQNTVQRKSDCHTDKLIPDMSQLSHFWLRDEYRYACLIQHYQAMLGNSITQKWLPPACLDIRDKLVIMQHSLQNIRLARVNNTPPTLSLLTETDLSLVHQCEGFLDTPQIYSFLRDDAYTEREAQYIESQKQRIFKFR